MNSKFQVKNSILFYILRVHKFLKTLIRSHIKYGINSYHVRIYLCIKSIINFLIVNIFQKE